MDLHLGTTISKFMSEIGAGIFLLQEEFRIRRREYIIV